MKVEVNENNEAKSGFPALYKDVRDGEIRLYTSPTCWITLVKGNDTNGNTFFGECYTGSVPVNELPHYQLFEGTLTLSN